MIDYQGYSNYMNWLIDTKQIIIPPVPTAYCNYCNAEGLRWMSDKKLHDAMGNVHSCRK